MSIKKYICDKEFLRMVLMISLPVVFQQIIESLVSLADSVMVSSYSQIGVSAVQIGSQWEEIAFLLAFGICSGVGIYLAQFFGSKDYMNLKRSFGTMIILALLFSAPFILAAMIIPEKICEFYISDPTVIDAAASYLRITSFSYIFVMISTCYNFSYRCMRRTKVPFVISSISVILNCILNYLLIFGHLGLPELGIAGAAIATVVSRGIGSAIYMIYSIVEKEIFLGKPKEMITFDPRFLVPVMKRIIPTIANEGLFGIGQTFYYKAYGALGVVAVTSISISNKISNLFFVVIWALCSALQSMVGNTLGENDLDKAKKYADYFMGLGVVFALGLGLIIAITANPVVHLLYSTQTSEVKSFAIAILVIYSLKFALRLFNSFIFSLLRAGGDTKFLAFIDSGILYLVGIPLALVCVYVLKLGIIQTVLILQLEQVVRIIIAFKRYLSGKWCMNVTKDVA